MTVSPVERDAMRRALDLAKRGWGRVAPNPLVGAVLLRDDKEIGSGFHAEFGGDHAEAAALKSCADPTGATCVVTLEPCAHQGKTPSCALALRDAKITRVIAAIPDANPSALGGSALLRAAGIEVIVGVAAEEAAAQNAPFLWALRRPDRPFVALKVATSLDGFLADASGTSRWISGPEAREFVHWLRAGFDAIAVGRRTAELDDPLLTVRGSVTPRIPPRRIVISSEGQVDPHLQLFQHTSEIPTIMATANSSVDLVVPPHVEVVRGDSLREMLLAVRATGVQSLLVEGGGALSRSLLQGGLVDRLYWIQAPMWLGEGNRAFGSTPTPLADARRWRPTERSALGEDTLVVLDRELCLPES